MRCSRSKTPPLISESSARKLVGDGPGEELYTLALAGDGPLPTVPAVTVLGGALDAKQLVEQARNWEERAVLAEADAAAWRTDRWSAEAIAQDLAKELTGCEGELRRLELERRELERQLNVVLTSRSWRLTRPLRAVMAAVRERTTGFRLGGRLPVRRVSGRRASREQVQRQLARPGEKPLPCSRNDAPVQLDRSERETPGLD